MIEVVRTVRTPCPHESVADYLSDFSTTAEWDPHTASCTRVGGGVGLRPGVAFDNTQRIGPWRTTMRYTVTSFEAGRGIRLHSSSRLLDAEDSMSFDGDADGTTVTYTVRFQLRGPAVVAEPLLRRLLDKVADDGAEGMRRTLAGLDARTRRTTGARHSR